MRAPDRSPEHIESIAYRLRLSLDALGLNQAEVCRLTGIAPNALNQWLKAKNRPDLDNGLTLCRVLGLTLDWIYRGDLSGLPYALVSKLRDRVA